MEVDDEMMEVDDFQMTISDFPGEVTLEILELLDFESLKTASLVCKKWNEIIGSSAKLMKNFVLNLDKERVENLDKRFRSRRKHVNVFIYFEVKDDKLLDVVKQFDLSQARRVSFHRYNSSINIKQVRKVLAKMPMLEDASLMLNKVEVPKRALVRKLRMENFKRIRFFPYACSALKLFNPKQIVELRVEEGPITDDIDKLLDFMHETINLDILRVNKTTFNAIFQHERNFSFQLSKLDLLYHKTQVSVVVNENFNKFLQSQASSVKVLNLSGLEGLSNAVHTTILGRVKKLTKLTIVGSYLPEKKEFYQKLKKSQSLKALNLHENFSSDEAAKGILGILPELEELSLGFSISTKINFIAANNPKLKHLACNSIHRSLAENLRFNNLKFLSVLSIADVNHWLSIVKNSPDLESLTVFWVDGQITDDVIDELLQHPSLQSLKVSGRDNNMNSILSKLKSNHGQLKNINLAIKNGNNDYRQTEVIIELHDHSLHRNFCQEKKVLAGCTWKEVEKKTHVYTSVHDLVKFKFETGVLRTVFSTDMVINVG